MLNAEKYKNMLTKMMEDGELLSLAVKLDGTPCACEKFDCANCKLMDAHQTCSKSRLQWLLSEYVERTIRHDDVAIDTEIYVSDHQCTIFNPDECRPVHYAGWNEYGPNAYPNGRSRFTNQDRMPITYSYGWLPDGTRIV